MMDGRRPAGIMSGDPAAVQALAPVYRWLQESPDTAYRASLLPMRRTVTGELQPAIPGALLDLMRGGVDLMAGPQTGVMTPEATTALATMGGTAAFSRPQGATLAAMRGPSANAALDMSEAARMARAAEQGFDIETPVYHGTRKDIRRFDTKKSRTNKAFFFSTDPQFASSPAYTGWSASGGNVMKAYIRAKNPMHVKDLSSDPFVEGGAIQRARDAGYDAIFVESDGRRIVFDPANIRSAHAGFDPKLRRSGDVLASGGVPMVPTQQRDERR